MAQKPAGTRAAAPKRPRGTTAVGDWRDVAEALETLGDTIARATAAAVENEEIRTRLRDLAEGLAALSLRVSASLGEIAGSGEVDARPLARPYAPVRHDQFRPQVLDAVSAANEKFRRAAEDWENPTQEMAPVAPVARVAPVVPVRAPIVAGAVAPVAFATPNAQTPAAFAAAPTIEMPAVSARPAAPVSAAAAGLSPDKLAAVKAASQRFAAERREAEESAAVVAPPAAPAPAPAEDGIESWLAAAPAQAPEVAQPVIETPPAPRAPRRRKTPPAAQAAPEPLDDAVGEAPQVTEAAKEPQVTEAAEEPQVTGPATEEPQAPEAAPAKKTGSRGKAAPAEAVE